jgi:protease-4
MPEKKNGIGVVRIGRMLRASSWNYYPILFELFARQDIVAIVLNLESPGGDCALVLAMYDDIMQLKTLFKKPVISYVEDNALSGGYTVACAGDHIISSQFARIGSIGVITARWDFSKKNTKEGVNTILVSENSNDTIFRDELPFSESKRKFLKSNTDFFYVKIKTKILASRPRLFEKNEASWNEAQIFSGRKALELGLVDQLGCPNDVIDYLRIKCSVNITRETVSYLFTELLGSKESPVEVGRL